MFDDILIPTDASGCAQTAFDYAVDLAETQRAVVHVLSVADTRTLENAPNRELREDECAEIVERAADRLLDTGLVVEEAVEVGVPHRAILEYATREGCDLVVMGTHGRTGVERFLLGSVTEKVVRLSDVPVLTVGPADADGVRYPYGEVLVPTDGSDRSTAAVGPGIDIASRYGARLHALSVVDPMVLSGDVGLESLLGRLEESAQEAVDAIQQRATRASVPEVETVVELGSPYARIRAYVTEHDIDLVVMGTHGSTGLERYLLGSVAEKMVRTSPVPVLTVRYPENPD